MDSQFDELKKVLSDEVEIHNSLVKTAQDMNKFIKEKDIAAIQRLTALFDAYSGQIESKENRRLEICDNLTKKIKPENRHTNLNAIISLLPENQRKVFTEIRNSLKAKISELSKLNTSNRILLNESLEVIAKNFDLIMQFQNKLAGYKQSGTMDKTPVRRNIVNQTA